MDIKTVTTGIVALIITVMVVALVAVPIVEDATQGTSYSGSNTDYDLRYTDFTGKAVTYTWTNNVATVNGDSSPNSATPSVISDKIVIRSQNGRGCGVYDLTSGARTVVEDLTSTVTLAVTAQGAYTVTIDETETYTGTLSTIIVSTTDGAIGHYTSMVKTTLGAKVYIGSFFNNNTLGPNRFAEAVNGQVTGGLFDPWYVDAGGDIVAGAEAVYDIDYTTMGEGQQVGAYTGVTTTAGSLTVDSFQLWAPIEFTSTAVENEGGINGTLLAIVPLLLFVVAVMMAVRLIRGA